MKCPKCNFDNPVDTKFCGECAAPLHPSEEISAPLTETLETPKEELTTGFTFAGRYQIIEELGKGGMGKVYRVLDKELKEEVALKLIRQEIASDKKTLERFRNELKLARKISHKNVGRMYELMEEKGTRYITMEYVPGEDLKRLIRKVGQFSAGKTVSIAKQVCEGLAEAHRLGVVHRDLKPQNVMVDEEGNARILDFGIARSLKAKGITGAGVMVGTPEYMSPEQAEVKDVDQRSDIYSLGVILYEMVTGRVPFEGETPLGIAMKHKSEVPKDPRELNAQIPEDLNQVILRCMEKDREKRYQSAGELRSELTRIEKGIPTTERVVPKRKPITSKEITVTFRLKKLFIPALVVIAIAVIAVIIWQIGEPGVGTIGKLKLDSSDERRPIVVMMDTPARPYDEEDRNRGVTNADVISAFLADFGVLDLRKESTNPQWNREDVIVTWNPDLIIIHYSCFAEETVQAEAYEKLDSFLEYVARSTKSHILMYSRSRNFWPSPDRGEVRRVATLPPSSEFLRKYETRYQLSGRITILGFAAPASASFRDPAVARRLKLEVKRILGLE